MLVSMLVPLSMPIGSTASGQKPLVVAWIYKVTPEVYRVVEENHEYIGWLSPDWFVLKDNGTIGEFTERGANDLNLINMASEYGIQVHPMVVSNVPERMHQLFTDPRAFNNFANALIELAKTYGYNGFNIDFEAPMLEDAQAFAQFLSMLAYRLHKAGLKLTVAVAAKRMDYSANSFLGAYDYKALGQSGVDYIMIMAYDYYELKGAPRPVAPPDWVEACVRYALAHIPREKLLLGIPSYGRERTTDGKHMDRHMYDYIASLIKKQGLKPAFDETYKEKYLDLGSTVIYYNDQETVVYKAKIARKYDLPGVAVWRLDGGDPLIWPTIYKVLTQTTTTSTQTTTTTSTT
ncbi:MAG: glycosyl hydrolase family 18 protein, partial [Candidatus Korarchaeota archaeon]|nr:glycosyl hydrolase family 18 protein [Candidatus Korarchaeota archaeon]